MLVHHLSGTGVGLVSELAAFQEQILLHSPVRRKQILLPVFGIAPFDNAAYLYVGKGEAFGQILESMPFDDGLVEWLTGERSHGTVRCDRTGFHVNNVEVRAPVA